MPNGLGFGLGLNQGQQQGFARASRQGNLQQYLGNHPGAANRISGGIGDQNAAQQQRFANHLSRNAAATGSPASGAAKGGTPTNGASAAPPPSPPPPTGNPGTGANKSGDGFYKPTGNPGTGASKANTPMQGGAGGGGQNASWSNGSGAGSNTGTVGPQGGGMGAQLGNATGQGGFGPATGGQNTLPANGLSAQQNAALARFPEMQALVSQRAQAQQGAPPAPAWDPANVTHTINGQRVALNQQGNVQMQGGNPALAGADGRPNGQTIQPTGDRNAPQGPGYQQGLDAQFGANNPFGQRDFYGDNPLVTAQNVAQRAFDENLAQMRARAAAGGFGNSARADLQQGSAAADFATGLGDVIAQRGEGAYQNDAARGLQALLGAGQLGNQRDQTALQANQQLAGLGTGLTGVGAQEQGIPNLGEILGFLGAFQSISGQGNNKSRGASGFGFKN